MKSQFFLSTSTSVCMCMCLYMLSLTYNTIVIRRNHRKPLTECREVEESLLYRISAISHLFQSLIWTELNDSLLPLLLDIIRWVNIIIRGIRGERVYYDFLSSQHTQVYTIKFERLMNSWELNFLFGKKRNRNIQHTQRIQWHPFLRVTFRKIPL